MGECVCVAEQPVISEVFSHVHNLALKSVCTAERKREINDKSHDKLHDPALHFIRRVGTSISD